MFISIRHKLGISLFVSIFGLTLLVVSVQQYHSYIRFRDHARQSLATTIRIAIDLSDNWIREKMNAAQVLAYGVEKSLLTSGNIREDLNRFAQDNELKSAYLGLENGDYIDTTGWSPEKDYVFKTRPWYSKAKQSGRPVFVPPYIDAMTNEYSIAETVNVRMTRLQILSNLSQSA